MDLKELETFVKVAEFKSFSKTAQDLSVTQPTITNHIQGLEKSLNTVLMDRRGKQVTLTSSGELLYRYAIDILNSCAMAKHELHSNAEELVGHLSIESCAIPRKYLLPRLIKGFLDENPKITFNITGDYAGDSIEKLKKRELDFAIVGYTTKDEDIEYIKILEEDILLVLPNTAEFKNYSHIDAQEILNYKLILKENTFEDREIIYGKLKAVGIKERDIQVVGFSQDLDTTKRLISLGVGCSFLTKKSIEQDLKLGNYKAVYIKGLNSSRNFYFSYPKTRHIFPINEMFKNYLLDFVKI